VQEALGEEAIKRRGLRMVVVGDVPSPWGEAEAMVFADEARGRPDGSLG
jgi:hypothetical protein